MNAARCHLLPRLRYRTLLYALRCSDLGHLFYVGVILTVIVTTFIPDYRRCSVPRRLPDLLTLQLCPPLPRCRCRRTILVFGWTPDSVDACRRSTYTSPRGGLPFCVPVLNLRSHLRTYAASATTTFAAFYRKRRRSLRFMPFFAVAFTRTHVYRLIAALRVDAL